MNTGALRDIYEDEYDLDSGVRERMDIESDMITEDYNRTAAMDYDFGYDFDYDFEEPETEDQGLSASDRQYAKDTRRQDPYFTVCIVAIALAICMCMFMMVKGVAAKEQLARYTASLSALKQDTVRLETEIEKKCGLGAVSDFAEKAGLRKASQYQTIYVGGRNESGGIVSNAAPDEDDSGRLWSKLKSFFD